MEFSVNDVGDILFHAKLDREKQSIYELSASLINIHTKQKLDADEPFVIVVLDINDSEPVFPPALSGSISESSRSGSFNLHYRLTHACYC